MDTRSLFPELEARAYWSFAAIAPLAAPVRAAIDGWHAALATRGMPAFGEAIEARERLRTALAALCGGRAEDYALTQGTTGGVVAVARSLKWRPGDVIVTFRGEFPTNVIPWHQAARDFGLEVVQVDAAPFAEPDEALSRLSSILRAKRVRLVAVSAVEFQSGLAMPVAALAAMCHEVGARLAVDAIQAAGVMPLDLARAGVDFAYGGGHKWLVATDGVGWVYVSPEARDELGDAMVGWLSVEDAVDFLFEPERLSRPRGVLAQPRRLEGGSTSSAAVFGLLAGVGLCLEAGPDKTFAHVQRLHDRVEGPIVAMGFSSERARDPRARSGTLSFLPPRGVSLRLLQGALGKRGVVVTIPDGRLRLAPHFFSTEDEAQVIIEALPEALGEAAVR